jgi:hypothetical protein
MAAREFRPRRRKARLRRQGQWSTSQLRPSPMEMINSPIRLTFGVYLEPPEVGAGTAGGKAVRPYCVRVTSETARQPRKRKNHGQVPRDWNPEDRNRNRAGTSLGSGGSLASLQRRRRLLVATQQPASVGNRGVHVVQLLFLGWKRARYWPGGIWGNVEYFFPSMGENNPQIAVLSVSE